MSYVRFAWDGSDVYVYESQDGLECCGCMLNKTSITLKTEEEMISHLGEHRRKGFFVPEYAITGLWNAIPGATKARKPEPLSFTRSNLQMEIHMISNRLEKIKEKK